MAKKEKISVQEYIIDSAANKKKTVSHWFDDTVDLISQCSLATHVGKFSHPDVKISCMQEYSPQANGYVTTRNTKCSADILTPAQYIGAANLLLKDVDDNQNVLEAIESHSKTLSDELDVLSLSSENLSSQVTELQARSHKEPVATDYRLKQVYFPINQGSYHLLTVMPASSLLIEVRKRILATNAYRRTCYDEKEENYGKDCEQFIGMTIVGFGGTKPQNISALNSKQGGRAYLLPSLPPQLREKEIRLPKRDYFKEILWYRQRADVFYGLHKQLKKDRNNLVIREQISQLVDQLVDYTLGKVYLLRSHAPGWSDEEAYMDLPSVQKIWLDDK